MEIKFEVCDVSGEAIVCKVSPTDAQLAKIEKAIPENSSDMFERNGDLANVAETIVSGVNCVSFLDENNVLIMSIQGPDYMDCITICEDKEMQERAIAETWMLFVPHLKKFI